MEQAQNHVGARRGRRERTKELCHSRCGSTECDSTCCYASSRIAHRWTRLGAARQAAAKEEEEEEEGAGVEEVPFPFSLRCNATPDD